MNSLENITEESKWLEKKEHIDKWTNLIISDKIPFIKIPIDQKKHHSDNIDFFMWKDAPKPVMKGIDVYNRPFITIKVIIDNKQKFMQTFFQRYTNEKYTWVGCISSTTKETKPTLYRNDFLYTSGGMNKEQFKLVTSLINNYLDGKYESITIENRHKTHEIFIGKNVRIYDEETENAYNLICRAWIKCRFDPSYKMCKKIQEYKYNTICIN